MPKIHDGSCGCSCCDVRAEVSMGAPFECDTLFGTVSQKGCSAPRLCYSTAAFARPRGSGGGGGSASNTDLLNPDRDCALIKPVHDLLTADLIYIYNA